MGTETSLESFLVEPSSLAVKLQGMALCKNTQDIVHSAVFFEKDVLGHEEFAYLQHLFIPTSASGSGFRRVPYLANSVAPYYDESFLLQATYTKAFDVLSHAEIPSLKPTGEKVKISVIELKKTLLPSEQEMNLSDDSGEDYTQSKWQKILTILGLAINEPVVVSAPVLLYIQEQLSGEFEIHHHKEMSMYKKEIDLVSDYKFKSPFDLLVLKNLDGIKTNVEYAYNQFPNMPKNQAQSASALEQKSFCFYYLQSFLLHQQLRLSLVKKLMSYEFIDSFDIDCSTLYDGQLFTNTGLNFYVFSKDLNGEKAVLDSRLSGLFWHLYEDGFLILGETRIKGMDSKLSFTPSLKPDAFTEFTKKQVDLFAVSEEISDQAKIYILLLLILSANEPKPIFDEISELINNQDYTAAVKSIIQHLKAA